MRSLLCSAVVLAVGLGPCFAAAPLPRQAEHVATAAPRALYMDVLEGEGELNDIRARTAREPVVQVKDENHKPVAGALVLFALRSGGAQPVSTFSGLPTLAVRTDANGIARAQGYHASRAGTVQIVATATVGAVVTQVIIHQTNYIPGGRLQRTVSTHKALIGSVAELAAFAIAASVVVVDANNGTSAATITVGTGTVSASRLAPAHTR